MSDFRRYFVPGGTYFFTLVTAQRTPLFKAQHARTLLGELLREECAQHPFTTVAIVLLPDHLHAIWTLPPGDDAYPQRWQAVKAKFTRQWLELGGAEESISPGYRKERRRGVWQPRYIEHTIRDERDLQSHADYVHYNPVKHGYVCSPKDWPWSSFRRYVSGGECEENWGSDAAAIDLRRVDSTLLE